MGNELLTLELKRDFIPLNEPILVIATKKQITKSIILIVAEESAKLAESGVAIISATKKQIKLIKSLKLKLFFFFTKDFKTLWRSERLS